VKIKKRKSVSLPLNAIIISILFLIVLVGLIIIFFEFNKKQKEDFTYKEDSFDLREEWENINYESLKYDFIANYNNYLETFDHNLEIRVDIKRIEEIKNLNLYHYLLEKLNRYGKTEREIMEDLYFIIEYSKKLKVPLVVSTYVYIAEKTPRFKVSSTYRYGPFQIGVKAVKDVKTFLKGNYGGIYNELEKIENKYKDFCKYNGYSCVGGCKIGYKRPDPEPWMIVTCKGLKEEQILEVVKLNIAYGIAYIALTKKRVNEHLPNLEEELKWIVTILSYHLGICFAEVVKKRNININDLKDGEKLANLIEYYAKEGKVKYCKGKKLPRDTYAIKYAHDFLKFSYFFDSLV